MRTTETPSRLDRRARSFGRSVLDCGCSPLDGTTVAADEFAPRVFRSSRTFLQTMGTRDTEFARLGVFKYACAEAFRCNVVCWSLSLQLNARAENSSSLLSPQIMFPARAPIIAQPNVASCRRLFIRAALLSRRRPRTTLQTTRVMTTRYRRDNVARSNETVTFFE